MRYAILACSGVDKPEGSLSREVAIRLAEKTGGDIICPVLANRAPARYKKALSEGALVLVDGCATRCAGKLATELAAKPEHRVVLSELLKARGEALDKSPRLHPEGMALAETIAKDIVAALNASTASPEPGGQEKVTARGSLGVWEVPTDFAVVVHDKFEFRIPKSGFYFNENDVWAHLLGNRARVGISDYMQQWLTDINYFDPPAIGAVIEQFGELGSVESTKAAFDILSPVSGTVVAVNQEAVDSPELINEDPYGRGWLAEVELADWQGDQELLLSGADYAATVERKAAEG